MDQQPPDADDREEDRAEGSQTEEEDVLGEISPEEDVEEPPAEEPPRPRRRQRSRMIGCLLALLGALAGGGVAWWVSYDGADQETSEQIGNTTVEREQERSTRVIFAPTPTRPDETPEIISAETSVIYCFYELGGIPADATLSAEWSHDGEPLGELAMSDQRPDDDVEYARGRFTVHPPADDESSDGDADVPSFPPGIYEVRLTSSEYPDVTATGSFVALPRAARVLQGGGDVEGPPLIRSLQTATGVTEDGQPVDRMSAFPPDTGRITAVFSYSGVPAGSVLTVRWHAGGQEITDARSDIPISASDGWAEGWLETNADETLPPGDYRVSVHLGDDEEPLGSTGFSVQPAD